MQNSKIYSKNRTKQGDERMRPLTKKDAGQAFNTWYHENDVLGAKQYAKHVIQKVKEQTDNSHIKASLDIALTIIDEAFDIEEEKQ